jgi:hypothetical protein
LSALPQLPNNSQSEDKREPVREGSLSKKRGATRPVAPLSLIIQNAKATSDFVRRPENLSRLCYHCGWLEVSPRLQPGSGPHTECRSGR